MRNKGIWAALVVILAVLTLRLGFWAVGGRGSVVYADAPQAGPVASQTDGALKEIRTLLPSRAIPPKGSSSSAAAGATDIPALPDVQALLQAHPAQPRPAKPLAAALRPPTPDTLELPAVQALLKDARPPAAARSPLAPNAAPPGVCSNNTTQTCSTNADCGTGNTCLLPSPNGICSNNNAKSCSANADCGAGNTCFKPTRGGDTVSNVCLEDAAGSKLQCTANDVSLTAVTDVVIVHGCDFPGDTAVVSFVAQFKSTSTSRYNVGIWIAQDGGNARTGACSVTDFPSLPVPPWQNLDSNACGDITSAKDVYAAYQYIHVPCVNPDPTTGRIRPKYCTSWDNQAGTSTSCTTPLQTVPGTGSKCSCDNTLADIPVTVPGTIVVNKVTNPNPNTRNTNFPFSLSGGASANFNLQNGGTWNSSTTGGFKLMPGTYQVAESVPSGWTLTSSSCTSSITGKTQTPGNIQLTYGETVTCTYTDTGLPAMTLTKTASPTVFLKAGDVIHYTMTATNSGNIGLTGVSISDTDTLANSVCKVDNVVVTPPVALGVGKSLVCEGDYTITSADVAAGKHTNTATATSSQTNPITASVTVNYAKLTLTKSATPSFSTPARPGDTISYGYAVQNTGNVALNSIVVSDNKCTPSYVSGDSNTNSLLDPGETWQYTCTYALT